MNKLELEDEKTVLVRQGCSAMEVNLAAEDGIKLAAEISINGVWHHFERIKKETLVKDYTLDSDPNYDPQCDDEGYCYIMVPFSKSS
jgi:hypothetical protein